MKIRLPDEIKLFTDIDSGHCFRNSSFSQVDDVSLDLKIDGDDLKVKLTADTTPVFHIRLRWNFTNDEKRFGVRILGDSWERSYGELEWRGIVPERFMPWYILVSNGTDSNLDTSGRFTECFGVSTLPSAMCTWQYDSHGVNLWLDVRCGGEGVILGGRQLDVCTVLFREYRKVSAFEAGVNFCRIMCPNPKLPSHKVYGSNNWYYAVGDSSREMILEDTKLIATLTEGLENRPYMVVDDGWQINPCDGPWISNEKFGDMKTLAAEMKTYDVKPGIWVRFLLNTTLNGVSPEMCIDGRPGVLDPSREDVLSHVKDTVKELVAMGYKLIKHDFTHTDMFVDGGHTRAKYVTDNGWHFHDRSKTSAEIAVNLFKVIQEAADDDTIILACCTPSHLTAGLAHLMRVGFDTSGRHFERTRISGVNTLAFRLMQNGTFYMIDADCCSHTGRIDWNLNSEWLRLLSDSGSPLFISSDPKVTASTQQEDMSLALMKNGTLDFNTRPLDWMENSCPEVYLVNGEVKSYSWYAFEGTHQFIPPTEQEY